MVGRRKSKVEGYKRDGVERVISVGASDLAWMSRFPASIHASSNLRKVICDGVIGLVELKGHSEGRSDSASGQESSRSVRTD